MKHIKLFESFSLADTKYKYKVYHGTDAIFDEFEVGDNQHGNLYGKGIYFTDNVKYAKMFGSKIMECEIVMYKPFDMTVKDMSHMLALKKYIKDPVEREMFDDGYRGGSYTSVLNRLRYKGMFTNDMLEKLGYDGIIGYCEIGGKEYVVFSPMQVNIIK